MTKSKASESATSHLGATALRNTGRFTLSDNWEKGGQGTVFRAWDNLLEREVAIKLLHEPADSTHRSHHEARILSRMNHPNICEIYEIVETEIGPGIVMEYVVGQDLLTFAESLTIARNERIRAVLELALQVAEALEAAQKLGVIHGDLKFSNILVSSQHIVKIVDFGLARVVEPDDSYVPEAVRTAPDMRTSTFGTVGFMSPEQALGDKKRTGPSSDVFSLGVCLYEILSRRQFYHGFNSLAEYQKFLDSFDFPSIFHQLELEPTLAKLVENMLAQSPEQRPSASEVASRIRKLLALPQKRRRARLRNSFLGALVILLIILATLVYALSVKSTSLSAELQKSEAILDFSLDLFEVADPRTGIGPEATAIEMLETGLESAKADFSDRPEVLSAVLNRLG